MRFCVGKLLCFEHEWCFEFGPPGEELIGKFHESKGWDLIVETIAVMFAKNAADIRIFIDGFNAVKPHQFP
jgi:hypothetical protein